MSKLFVSKLPAGARSKNRRLGWMLALLTLLYLAAVIGFIVVY